MSFARQPREFLAKCLILRSVARYKPLRSCIGLAPHTARHSRRLFYFFLFLLGRLSKNFRRTTSDERQRQHHSANASRRCGPRTSRNQIPGRNFSDDARAWRTGSRREREHRPPREFPPSSDKSN